VLEVRVREEVEVREDVVVVVDGSDVVVDVDSGPEDDVCVVEGCDDETADPESGRVEGAGHRRLMSACFYDCCSHVDLLPLEALAFCA
jgi:hypothetical protein